jgi:hypothetical protein
MNSDRELLEMAAKAAGIDLQTKTMFGGDAEPGYYKYGNERPEWNWWNPLSDDGDALRLAVKLRIELDWTERGAPIAFRSGVSIQETQGDAYCATRRAIVRAAAELGRAL